MAFAHAELCVDTPIHGTSLYPERELKIRWVTKCAVSFCARNYKLAVIRGIPSIPVSEPDWGELFNETRHTNY
ncbi:hypothetical protein BDV27DRAFT_132457 [Aspergillus caelatus]|uniref:Uncharacterized protein n=1 Tax=Aspergillus caelatus TaxID=61420 RepID=A0A5N6ZW29_9EURO|nr:uncharacterized protein BDV27DRAFT_132457 [Aspergillus caelatus]KAE8361814.1 hypothetical protein BDV27DRAFT_132457 [Aspergillus caelatus]